MFRKIFIPIVLAIAILAGSASFANAQSPNLEGIKAQVESLVTAKDEGKPNELAVRIETFKKVIEFSLAEAKDLKIKLLALDGLAKDVSLWRDKAVQNMNQALVYYEGEQENIEENEKISLATIKTVATDFKKWREETYLPTAEEINDFFLITQEEKAVETALKRWQRIEKDLVKLEKAKIKGVPDLRKLLDNAGGLIAVGGGLNQEAKIMFFARYVTPLTLTATSTDEATSTTEGATSTQDAEMILADGTETASGTRATSTEDGTTTVPLILQTASIKDLVESSLVKIRETYQIFIEMSNLVRKLLE